MTFSEINVSRQPPFEARHQPGTIAYSTHLQLAMPHVTVSEMARNGCQKIIIVNGHGGNNFLLQYFAQTTGSIRRKCTHMVYAATGARLVQMPRSAVSKPWVWTAMPARARRRTSWRIAPGSHTRNARRRSPCRSEPGLNCRTRCLHLHLGGSRSSRPLSGNTSQCATAARGDAATRASAARIANAFRAIKRDETGPALQKEFFDKAAKPIATKQ